MQLESLSVKYIYWATCFCSNLINHLLILKIKKETNDISFLHNINNYHKMMVSKRSWLAISIFCTSISFCYAGIVVFLCFGVNADDDMFLLETGVPR